MELTSFSQGYNNSIFFDTLQEFAKTALMIQLAGGLFYSLLRLLLFTTTFLGFGFYLWFLSNSDDQTQTRLLNILNGYLSVACMGFSPIVFITYHASDEYMFQFCFRIGSHFIMAISSTFLLISFATILNHFKPDFYLEFSLRWRHKIAVPTLLLSFVLTEQLVNLSCPENFYECQISKFRSFIIMPSNITSFVCQLVVIIDVIFRWTHIYKTLRRFFQPNQVDPITEGGLEQVALPLPYATPQPDQHLVGGH